MLEDKPVVSVIFGDEDLFVVHVVCSREREQIVSGSSPEIPLCPHREDRHMGRNVERFLRVVRAAALTNHGTLAGEAWNSLPAKVLMSRGLARPLAFSN
jgi:hypothetical protein